MTRNCRVHCMISYLKYIFVHQVPSVETLTLDIADWDATRTAVQAISDVDLLVNNAGVNRLAPFLDVTKEQLDT